MGGLHERESSIYIRAHEGCPFRLDIIEDTF